MKGGIDVVEWSIVSQKVYQNINIIVKKVYVQNMLNYKENEYYKNRMDRL